MSVGDRLKYLRECKGITQDKLAEIVNVKKSTISKYENNKLEISNETLVKFAKYFNVTTDYILNKANDKQEEHSNSNIIQLNNDGDFAELYKVFKKSDLSMDELKEIIKLYSKIKNKNK